MSNELDRGRYYALVYGDPVKKYYQDRTFFRGDGTPVNSDEPAKPPKAVKPSAVVVEQKKAKGNPADTLNGLHISKLKKMAVSLADQLGHDKPELKGKGLKKKLIAYIVENTD